MSVLGLGRERETITFFYIGEDVRIYVFVGNGPKEAAIQSGLRARGSAGFVFEASLSNAHFPKR